MVGVYGNTLGAAGHRNSAVTMSQHRLRQSAWPAVVQFYFGLPESGIVCAARELKVLGRFTLKPGALRGPGAP